MKKYLIIPMLSLLALTTLVGCEKKDNNQEITGPQEPLDLGDQFDPAYYPKPSDNNVANIVGSSSTKMRIDIAINFEDTAEAWEVGSINSSRLRL